MTVEVEVLSQRLDWDEIKRRIDQKIDEVEEEKDGKMLNADERCAIAKDMLGSFRADELQDGARVSESKAHDKVNYWVARGQLIPVQGGISGVIYSIPELAD